MWLTGDLWDSGLRVGSLSFNQLLLSLSLISRPLWSPQQVSATSSMRVFLPVLLAALLGVEQGMEP